MLLSRIFFHHWWFILHAQASYISQLEFLGSVDQTGVNVGDWLYIDGGRVQLASSPALWLKQNQTLSINLSKSWTTSLVTLNTIEKPTSCAAIRRPSLWFDSTSHSIYSFGGEPFELGSDLSIWTLLLDGQGGGTWTEKFSPTNAIFSVLTRPAYGLSTFSSTTGYSLGGIATECTSPETEFLTHGSELPLSGLTVFKFDVQSWTNISTSGYSDNGFGVSGAAQFISSFGKEGILIFIGGEVPSVQTDTYSAYTQKSMDQITIFDIHNQKWYHQKATGDVPTSTRKFCSSMARETQTGFYEIFVFGGLAGPDCSLSHVDSHQVYILTLPAFRWIRVTNSSTASRAGHHCLVIGNRQMLSIGGWNPTALKCLNSIDPWPYGLGIFDMTTLQWTDKYDAAAMPYVQPDQVKTYYSNGSRYPSTWNDSLLEAIFTNSSRASTATSKPGVKTDQAKNIRPKGVIFGSIFGGIGGLAVYIVAVWLWFKKRYKKMSAPRPIDKLNDVLQPKDAITYAMMPEMAATTPSGLNNVITLGIKPELAARTSAGLNDEYPYGIKPELAVTTPAGFRDRFNVEENVNLPQAQMLDPEARQTLPVRDFDIPANEIIELPGSFSR